MVEEWIGRSEENYRLARRIHTLYLAVDTVRISSEIDTERALAAVRRKMGGRSSWSGVWLWTRRIAAILFLPLLFALLLQSLRPRQETLAQMIEVRTNPGTTTVVHLPDSSVVYLNSESSLCYPSFFGEDRRRVTLRGEAFFEIRKESGRGFEVSASHGTSVEVLGTSFNMEAFEKDSFVTTTLLEGEVRFEGEGNRDVVMRPGEKLIYDVSSSRMRWVKTDGIVETAWKDGKVILRETLLPDALRMLEKRFDVEFVIANERLRKEAFTGTFSHQGLERILEMFKISSNIHWRYLNASDTDGRKVRIEIY